MAVKYERVVAEDLNLGVGEVDVTMPGGGTAVGHKIGPHTFHSLSFIASMDGGQTINSGEAAAVVSLDDEELDVADWYDPATYRLTPDVPGRYQIDAYVSMNGFNGKVTAAIYKNSTELVATEMVRESDTGRTTLSGLVSLDGDTDYVTLRVSYDGTDSTSVSSARMSGFITGKYDTSA